MNEEFSGAELDELFGHQMGDPELDQKQVRDKYTVLEEDKSSDWEVAPKPLETLEREQVASDIDSYMLLDSLPDSPATEEAAAEAPIVSAAGRTTGNKFEGVAKEIANAPVKVIQGILDVNQIAKNFIVDELKIPNTTLSWDSEKGFSVSTPAVEKKGSNVLKYGFDIPKAEETTAGNLVGGVAEIVVGYATMSKAFTSVGFASQGLVGAAARGFGADFIASNPEDGGVLKMVAEHQELKQPWLQYLIANEDDTEATQRLKLAVEGLGLGVTLDVLMSGFKMARRATNERNNANDGQGGTDGNTSTEADESPPKGPDGTNEAAEAVEEVTEETAAVKELDEAIEVIQPKSEAVADEVRTEDVIEEVIEKTEVELEAESLTNEINTLRRERPDDPIIEKLYDDMIIDGRISDRPSFINKEVTPTQAENIARNIANPNYEGRIESGDGALFNLNVFDEPQKVTDALYYTTKERIAHGLDSKTPFYRSQEETQQLVKDMADDMLADPQKVMDNLNKLSDDVGNLDVFVTQARVMQRQAATEASSLAERIIAFEANPREQLEFLRRLQVLSNVNEIMTGLKTGTGRALASMNIPTSKLNDADTEAFMTQFFCTLNGGK